MTQQLERIENTQDQDHATMALSTSTVDSSPAWLLNMTGSQLSTLERLAMFVAKSTFAKDINSMEKAITVMMQGMELGLQPMASVRNIHIINGRPSLSADLMAALVIKHGHPRIQITELTEQKCSARARRREETDWQEFTFTWQDAVKAQLAGKDTWQKHPKSMLRARSISGICHIVFPDLFAGVYVPEEMDGSMADGSEIQPPTKPVEPVQLYPNKSAPAQPAPAPAPAAVTSEQAQKPKIPAMLKAEFEGWLKEMGLTVEMMALALSEGKHKTIKEWVADWTAANPNAPKVKDGYRFVLYQYVDQGARKNPANWNWLWNEETMTPMALEDQPFADQSMEDIQL